MQFETKLKAMMVLSLQGDEKAYHALLTSLSQWARPCALRLFHRYGGHNQDVEDVVQDMLLALHLKKHTWQSSEAFMPWIATILRYKVIDNLRKRRIMADIPIEELGDTLEEAPQETYDSSDLTPLLPSLPAQQQQIIQAVLEEGLSQPAIALKLNITEGTVRVNLHRAVKTLAKCLRNREKD